MKPWKSRTALAVSFVVLLFSIFALFGYDRFPRPEFAGGYEPPDTPMPAPRSLFLEYLDVGVLAAALLLASYFALKIRYRFPLILLSLLSLAYFGFWRRGCVCPVGSVQNVVLSLTDTGYAVPLPVLAFFLMPLLATLFFGRTFCGSVCPLGALQDLVLIRPVRVPRWLGQVLGVVPYLYLGLTVLFVVTGSDFLTCRYDPFVSFFRFSGNLYVLLLSLSFLLLSLFVGRPYCRFLCPYGVILGWMSRVSRRHATVTPDECVRCRLCTDSCPYDAIRAATQPEEASAGGLSLKSRRDRIRRFTVYLLLLPVLVGTLGWAGSRLSGVLSRMNATVRLAEQILLEEGAAAAEADGEPVADTTEAETTLESRTFRASGTPTEELLAEAGALKRQFDRGGWVLGGFVGFILAARLIGLTIRRRRKNTEPDRAFCLSCGRCFASCPVEQSRRKESAALAR